MQHDTIEITFPDGSTKKYPPGITPLDIAHQISHHLAKATTAALYNEKLIDAFKKLDHNGTLKILTFSDKEGLDVFRHSSAHLLAQAVVELFPEAKLTIGPVVEEGFYYDIDHPPFSPEDLAVIEERMKDIVQRNLPVERFEVSKKEAREMFKKNPYKLELIQEMKEGEISVYQQGNFVDLCRGPHLPKTGLIKAFKLTKLAGAYWHGDARNKQLQRIYGISFPEKKQLEEYLQVIEEAKKRDHRVLGKKLDLFSFHDISPGSPFFHPKGTIVYLELQNFLRELYPSWGYQEVITPLIYGQELWEQSGHWEHYQEHIFQLMMDNRVAALKPMNCPSHILIFKTQTRSYRDLPFRITDFAPLHRNELKGVLGGLTRVRKFSQDDCHVFCTLDQVKQEIKAHVDHIRYVYTEVFGFEFNVELSTKPEKSMGDQKLWDLAEKSLYEVLADTGLKYIVRQGEGAFYGPKIDVHIKDSLGRTWQCATEQLDFQQPERFNVQYEGQDGEKHNVVMLHRTVLGSIERFMGILLEHFAGKLPLWLAPVQVRLMTLADRNIDYAKKFQQELIANKIRVELDVRSESIPKKVHDAQVEYIPLMITLGDKEEQNNTVAVRTLDGKVYFGIKKDIFLEKVLTLIKKKKKEIVL